MFLSNNLEWQWLQKQTKLLEWEEIVSSNLNCSGMKSSIDCGHDIENSLTVERLVFFTQMKTKSQNKGKPFGIYPHLVCLLYLLIMP